MSSPRLVESFYSRIWNQGDLAAISDLLTEEFCFRGSLGVELRGRDGFLEYVRSVRSALADYRCEILECATEGNKAFAKMRFSGIHVGLFRGHRPTGLPVHWLGTALFHIEGERIAELYVLGDLAGLDALLQTNAMTQSRQEGVALVPNIHVESLFCRCLHHANEGIEPGDPVEPPIVPASVYFLPGEPKAAHQYGRWTNPTWSALEHALSVLEDAETLIFSSGMAGAAAIFYTQLRAGDRVLLPSDGYYTMRSLAEKYLVPMGVGVSTRATVDYESGDFNGFRLVWVETPSNPGLDLCDIRSVASKAKNAGALVVVDNTTLTPLGQRPLDLGADVVISSDTKLVNGHSDTLLAHVASRNAEVSSVIRDWRRHAGAIPGPFEAWLVHRGLETLEVRFERMCDNAEKIARRLADHPKVQVRFPGLFSGRAQEIAAKQMLRFGTMIGVTFADKPQAERFINECKFIRATTSFGGVHTSAERRARWGDKVPDGFVRLSVGCEPAELLWGDMERVLDSL
jgi:cystathionine gamma-lyase